MENVATTTEGYLAYIDILGFKEMVESNSLEKLVELYRNIVSTAETSIVETNARFNLGAKGSKAQTLLFSDSIIIWMPGSFYGNFIKMIAILRQLYAESLYANHTLRGSVVYGELHTEFISSPSMEPSFLMLGKGLVQAYTLESKQQWHGCLIDERAYNTANESYEEYAKTPPGHKIPDTFDDLAAGFGCIKASIPYATGPIEQKWALNWVSYIFEKKYNRVVTTGTAHEDIKNQVLQAFSSHRGAVNRWDVRQKAMNTCEFVDSVTRAIVEAISLYST